MHLLNKQFTFYLLERKFKFELTESKKHFAQHTFQLNNLKQSRLNHTSQLKSSTKRIVAGILASNPVSSPIDLAPRQAQHQCLWELILPSKLHSSTQQLLCIQVVNLQIRRNGMIGCSFPIFSLCKLFTPEVEEVR